MSILRFCHERGQIKRWGAVRHVIVSGIAMRVFFIFIFYQEKWYSDICTFHVFLTFFLRFFEKMCRPKSAPEVSGRCLGPSPTYSGPIPTHFGPKPPKNNILEQLYEKIPIILWPIWGPMLGLL